MIGSLVPKIVEPHLGKTDDDDDDDDEDETSETNTSGYWIWRGARVFTEKASLIKASHLPGHSRVASWMCGRFVEFKGTV